MREKCTGAKALATAAPHGMIEVELDRVAQEGSPCDVGDAPAVVLSLSGRAWITGLHQYCLDPSDPFPQGYILSDT